MNPTVKLVNAFSRPYENAVATARTCYSSKGIIDEKEVSGDAENDLLKKQAKQERRDDLAKSIYQAGHHTTLQHAHFQFTLENVSRHFIWSFLHAHPYYNSEQVSQRYVEVKPGSFVTPPMDAFSKSIYEENIERQMHDYQNLCELLVPVVQNEYYKVFPARKNNSKYNKDIKKKAQEVARYVLPISTTAFLYHTISGITLLRYWRIAKTVETNHETYLVIQKMVDQLLEADPLYKSILEEPLNEIPEMLYQKDRSNFIEEFDKELDGKTSKLIDWKQNNERTIARSVREVLGILNISDQTAIEMVLNPEKNRLLGESMNLTTLSKLSRTLSHASYTFMKKLSHTADSQDQRHRMTPASRPIIKMHLSDRPDYITPELIKIDSKINKIYNESMNRSWEAYSKLRIMNSEDTASYILPNALSIRFTESADLLNLHHKMKMRLCYNAQEEIWKASLDEVKQIKEINPTIGKFLLPPCGIRKLSNNSPICPEGERYCGVPVWRLNLEDYSRLI